MNKITRLTDLLLCAHNNTLMSGDRLSYWNRENNPCYRDFLNQLPKILGKIERGRYSKKIKGGHYLAELKTTGYKCILYYAEGSGNWWGGVKDKKVIIDKYNLIKHLDLEEL